MYRLYLRNKLMNLRTRGTVPLTMRYQYNENVQSLKTLVPLIFMYGFCTVFGSVLVTIRQIRFSKTGPSDILQMIYLQAVYMSMDLFVLVGVPFMFVSYRPLRILLVSDVKSLFRVKSNGVRVVTNERFYQKHAPVNATDNYFGQYKEQWM